MQVRHLEPVIDESRNIFELNKAKKMTWFKGFSDYDNRFSFYSFQSYTSSPTLHYYKINFENFSYLRIFLNYVIDYRIKEKIDEISENELMD